MRKVNDVIMPFFLTAPRSHGPSRERRGSHIISAWYLTKKLPGPRPGYPRGQNTSGGPRSQLGSYPPRYTTKDQSKHRARIPWNTSRDLGLIPSNCLVLDQEPQQYIGGPTRVFCHGSNCLVSYQETQECTGDPISQLGSFPSSRRMALAAAVNLTLVKSQCLGRV
jgi:hypothetical protein